MEISAPCVLEAQHDLSNFQCTSPELVRWLLERARKNQSEGGSTCFVVCDEYQHVIGYYALAAGSIFHAEVPSFFKRNMPDPIPVVVLGRLAVHSAWVRRGIGRGLLKDAVQRTLQTAQQIGIRALLCHAIDENAKAFYLKHAFVESPLNSLTLLLSIPEMRKALELDV